MLADAIMCNLPGVVGPPRVHATTHPPTLRDFTKITY